MGFRWPIASRFARASNSRLTKPGARVATASRADKRIEIGSLIALRPTTHSDQGNRANVSHAVERNWIGGSLFTFMEVLPFGSKGQARVRQKPSLHVRLPRRGERSVTGSRWTKRIIGYHRLGSNDEPRNPALHAGRTRMHSKVGGHHRLSAKQRIHTRAQTPQICIRIAKVEPLQLARRPP